MTIDEPKKYFITLNWKLSFWSIFKNNHYVNQNGLKNAYYKGLNYNVVNLEKLRKFSVIHYFLGVVLWLEYFVTSYSLKYI